jgi:hypothetical protein
MHNSDDGTSNLETFTLWTLSIAPFEEMVIEKNKQSVSGAGTVPFLRLTIRSKPTQLGPICEITPHL